MTLNERVRANERSVANVCLGLTGLLLVTLLLAVGLITFTEHQQRQISELKTELQEKANEIEKLQNRNSAQDIILNKLNTEYQLKERQKAEEAKRIADENGVGG
jgi:Tfp pilus assembly protein PilN